MLRPILCLAPSARHLRRRRRRTEPQAAARAGWKPRAAVPERPESGGSDCSAFVRLSHKARQPLVEGALSGDTPSRVWAHCDREHRRAMRTGVRPADVRTPERSGAATAALVARNREAVAVRRWPASRRREPDLDDGDGRGLSSGAVGGGRRSSHTRTRTTNRPAPSRTPPSYAEAPGSTAMASIDTSSPRGSRTWAGADRAGGGSGM